MSLSGERLPGKREQMTFHVRLLLAFSIVQRCSRAFEDPLQRMQFICGRVPERRFRNERFKTGLRNSSGTRTLDYCFAETLAFWTCHTLC